MINIEKFIIIIMFLRTHRKKGGDIMATIMVDDSENLEKAIKRFKRMVEKEGIIREFKKREYFVKPSAINHQKKVTLERKLLNKKRKTEKKEY
mgnify:FL=1